MDYRIIHLSDLHLTSKDDTARTEPKLFGALTGMNVALRHVLKSEAIQSSNLIIVTGDVTDTGKIEEWQVFWKAVGDAGVSERVLVVPGNHDVCCLGLRPPGKMILNEPWPG